MCQMNVKGHMLGGTRRVWEERDHHLVGEQDGFLRLEEVEERTHLEAERGPWCVGVGGGQLQILSPNLSTEEAAQEM